MFKTIALLLAVVGDLVTSEAQTSPDAPDTAMEISGDYHTIPVTIATVKKLEKALSSAQYDGHKPHPSICVIHVMRVRVLFEDGWTYNYLVSGCPLPLDTYMGHCPSQNDSHPMAFDVDVFEQPWTKTLLVKSITWVE